MTDRRPPEPEVVAATIALIDRCLDDQAVGNPAIAAVERDRSDGERWFVRVLGEAKDTYSIWFEVRQRSLFFETFVMPAPEEQHAAFFEHLLHRNDEMFGMAFTVGAEAAIYLKGQLPLEAVTEEQLDRILGSVYAYVEQFFRPALRLGFASRMAG